MHEVSKPIRIALIDDHPVFRQGLRNLLSAEMIWRWSARAPAAKKRLSWSRLSSRTSRCRHQFAGHQRVAGCVSTEGRAYSRRGRFSDGLRRRRAGVARHARAVAIARKTSSRSAWWKQSAWRRAISLSASTPSTARHLAWLDRSAATGPYGGPGRVACRSARMRWRFCSLSRTARATKRSPSARDQPPDRQKPHDLDSEEAGRARSDAGGGLRFAPWVGTSAHAR